MFKHKNDAIIEMNEYNEDSDDNEPDKDYNDDDENRKKGK